MINYVLVFLDYGLYQRYFSTNRKSEKKNIPWLLTDSDKILF